MAILYVFLVHVIVCATAKGRDAGNGTRESLSIQKQMHEMNTNASNKRNKECRLVIKETDLTSLQQLAQSKIVHIVELDVRFASNISNSAIKGWLWNMTNNVGKEILSVLALKETKVTWTLDVGKKAAKVNILDNPPGCISFEKEPGDSIAGAILKQLSVSHDKEICFDEVSNISTQTKCCKTFLGNDPLKYQCYVSDAGSEFVNVVKTIVSVYELSAACGGFYLVVYCGIYLQLKPANNTINRFYKLTESPMSASSILCILFWDGCGNFKSFVRRCLFVVFTFLLLYLTKYFEGIGLSIWFALWAMIFPFYNFYKNSPVSDGATRVDSFWCRLLLKVFSRLNYSINDVFLSANVNTLGVISLITLPFNIKRWKKFFSNIIPDTLESSLKDKVFLYTKTGVYLLVVCILQVIFMFLLLCRSCISLTLKRRDVIVGKCNQQQRSWIFLCCYFAFEGCCIGISFIFVVLAFLSVPFLVISLLSGLILNVAYFFPYIVYISIVTFYSWMFWTSVEQKYVVLLKLIFDNIMKNNEGRNANVENNSNSESSNNNSSSTNDNGRCESNNNNEDRNDDVENNSNGNGSSEGYRNNDNSNINGTRNRNSTSNNNDRNSGANDQEITKIVCVVSKELYDDVRERVLPYHGNLFCFVVKVLGISVFAYLILTIVRVLQANDVSPTVQLLTTFSVSAFPYIMNTVAAKKGEEQKGAWREQLKHRVKPLVDELTVDKPDLRRTQLTIRHEIVVGPEGDELRESIV